MTPTTAQWRCLERIRNGSGRNISITNPQASALEKRGVVQWLWRDKCWTLTELGTELVAARVAKYGRCVI